MSLEALFAEFHTTYVQEATDRKCDVCERNPEFLEFACDCPLCREYGDVESGATTSEYVSYCFRCGRCACERDPRFCAGCALVVSIKTKDLTLLQPFLSE